MTKTFATTFLAAATLATSLFAQALTGSYVAEGRNADGSSYSGTVEIADTGSAVGMTWNVGSQNYAGQGQLDGRVLTVNWGAAAPVIYVVMPDGSLHGTWDNGRALEKLTRR